MKRLFLLIGLLLGFAASGWAETKTDTIYFEFELDEGVSSALITLFSKVEISMDYNDGQGHDRIISKDANYKRVTGNGYGRIYYTYEQPSGYSVWCAPDSYSPYNPSHTIILSPSSSIHITLLDVSGCTALTKLKCNGNRLTNLDVSKNTALTSLDCCRNQLTTLDVSGCTALTDLYCYNNQLTSLNASGCSALTELSCHNNRLTALDVSDCTALESLNLRTLDSITILDVSGCPP